MLSAPMVSIMAPPWIPAIIAAALGAALGWWPLHAWCRRSLTQTTGGPGMRVAAAVATGATFAVIAWRLADAPVLIAALLFASFASVLGIVDVLERRLPNTVILWMTGAVAVALILASGMSGQWMRLLWALIGGVAMFAVYLLLALISPKSMGMGDVKLAAPIGLLLGWFGLSEWMLGLLAGFLCGGVVAAVMLALRRTTVSGSLPFGPSMLAGALAAILLVG